MLVSTTKTVSFINENAINVRETTFSIEIDAKEPSMDLALLEIPLEISDLVTLSSPFLNTRAGVTKETSLRSGEVTYFQGSLVASIVMINPLEVSNAERAQLGWLVKNLQASHLKLCKMALELTSFEDSHRLTPRSVSGNAISEAKEIQLRLELATMVQKQIISAKFCEDIAVVGRAIKKSIENWFQRLLDIGSIK